MKKPLSLLGLFLQDYNVCPTYLIKLNKKLNYTIEKDTIYWSHMIVFNFHNHNCVEELTFTEIKNIAEVTQLQLHRAQTLPPDLDSKVYVIWSLLMRQTPAHI